MLIQFKGWRQMQLDFFLHVSPCLSRTTNTSVMTYMLDHCFYLAWCRFSYNWIFELSNEGSWISTCFLHNENIPQRKNSCRVLFRCVLLAFFQQSSTTGFMRLTNGGVNVTSLSWFYTSECDTKTSDINRYSLTFCDHFPVFTELF